MKPYQAQTYYELLEVSVSAEAPEIRSAYERLARLYADEQVAMYGIATPTRAQELKERLKEACETLCDDMRRADYDRRIGLPPRDADAHVPAPVWMMPAEKKPTPRLPVENMTAPATFATMVPPPRPSGGGQVASYAASEKVAYAYVPQTPSPALAPTPVAAPPPTEPVVEAKPVATVAPPAPKEVIPQEAPDTSASAPPEPTAEAVVAAAPTAPEATSTAVESLPVIDEPATAVVSVKPRDSKPELAAAVPETKPKIIEIPPDAEVNGEFIRKVREAKGYSLVDLADRTRIGSRHIENVEADRYAALPAPVYLRGMLMNIARELHIDGLALAKRYMQLVESHKSKR